MKNHIFFSHHLALRRKCGKRVGILCGNSLRYLQGTCFPYLCKGKIKAHREAGEFPGKMT